MAKGKEAPQEGEKKKGGLIKKLMLPLIAIICLGGGVFAGMQLGGGKAGAEEHGSTTGDEIVADSSGHGAPADDGHGAPADDGHGKPKVDSHGNPIESGGEESKEYSRRDLTFDFGKITVNLQSVNRSKPTYVQASIQLEANSIEGKTDIEDTVAPLRDATIMLLSSKQQQEIQSPAGMERLKRELLVRYEGLLGPHTVRNIYITELIVI